MGQIYRAWLHKAGTRYSGMLNLYRQTIDERPGFLTQEVWDGYVANWTTPAYKAKSEQASKN